MQTYKIKLDFVRDILGSQPASDDIKKEYIAKKMMTGRTGMSAEAAMAKIVGEIDNLNADEKYQATIEEMGDKSITVFYRNKAKEICISDIQLRGFFKDSFAFTGKENKYFKKKNGDAFSQDAYYRKWIGERIRFIDQYFPFEIQPEKMEVYQRPLRCETMMGPRVSLAASEIIRAPNSITFEIVCYDEVHKDMLVKCLERGIFKGCGQFGNGGWGSFLFKFL
jgi:hypothetical protein